eukprot:Transcript_7243.p2 GENE.Transcript_7243~~Transcript_7243.p2  ORF type:complete len:154 (+),score=25.82 Transcript_7243:1031-1492(+)
MLCVNAFQLVYVWDALYHEQAILTTMDITTDGFGYMLAFGDLSWVPFTYSLQARLLVDYDPDLPGLLLALLIGLNVLGYAIFRGANGQKDVRHPPSRPIQGVMPQMQTMRRARRTAAGVPTRPHRPRRCASPVHGDFHRPPPPHVWLVGARAQ